MLRWGGTMYIDDGKPTPAGLDKTLRNLREVSPTIYFSVPRAYDMLVPELRKDAALRDSFFRRLNLISYAGAALPQHLWSELEELSELATGGRVPMVSSWGSTETAPLSTDCHFQAVRSGVAKAPRWKDIRRFPSRPNSLEAILASPAPKTSGSSNRYNSFSPWRSA